MRWCVALLFSFGVVAGFSPGSCGAETLPTAPELQARWEASRGVIPAIARDTVVSTGSLGTTTTVVFRRGSDIRTTFDRGGFHSESGTYRGERWRQNYNGQTLVIGEPQGNEAAETITTTVSHQTTPVDAYVVTRVNLRQSGTRTFYDPSSYHIFRYENFGPNGTTVESYDEFATFGSATLAKSWTITSAAAKIEQHYERTEYIADAVSDADVSEAPTRRMLVEFPPGVLDVALPVQFINNNVIVRLMFGTRGEDFILDTGSSSIFMDTGVAQQLGLTLTNATSQVTAQRFTRYDTIVPQIAIGSLRMHDVAVSVGPVAFPEGNEVKAVGLIGFDFLAQLGVTIDYQNKTVHVVPADAYAPPEGAKTNEIPVRLGTGQPMTTVTVGKAVAEHMLFDTGGAGNIMFFDYFARRYPDTFAEPIGHAPMLGIGGPFFVDLFRLSTVDVGPIRFRNYIGARAPAGSYSFSGDGLIGRNLLSLFTVGLDYTHGRIFLTPNANARVTLRKD